jgi:hypothetical protein
MRIASIIVGALAFGLAGAASAQSIQPVSYSPDFQEALEDDLGVREGAYLSETLSRYVAEALEARGLSGRNVQIELSIVNARPNRPTFEQAMDRPGLDIFNSISVGGAELRGVVRNAAGVEVQTVEHRYYSHDLWDARFNADTWGDARRAMRRFATKVADAVAISAS